MLNSDDLKEIKIVLVGDMGVGKTTIIQRFSTGTFNPRVTPTVGAGSVKCSISLSNGSSIDLTIWDTAGQERYQSLIPLYLRKAKGVILVCDVTRKNTIQTLNAIYTSLTDVDSDCVMLLVGNKIDIEPEKDFSELERWAIDHNMSFLTASAKTGYGINEIFNSIANQIGNCNTDTNTPFNQVSATNKSICCF